MKEIEKFNEVWFTANKKKHTVRSIITMYYDGKLSGNELWHSADGSIKKFTNAILKGLR